MYCSLCPQRSTVLVSRTQRSETSVLGATCLTFPRVRANAVPVVKVRPWQDTCEWVLIIYYGLHACSLVGMRLMKTTDNQLDLPFGTPSAHSYLPQGVL